MFKIPIEVNNITEKSRPQPYSQNFNLLENDKYFLDVVWFLCSSLLSLFSYPYL